MQDGIVVNKPLEFMSREVFTRVREEMKKGGLYLFSEVVINQDDVPYHVPAKFAQTTKQFYYCEQKKLVIVLTHNENTYGQGDNPDHLSAHWEIEPIIGFRPSWEELESLAPDREVGRIPFFDLSKDSGDLPHHFSRCGGSYSGMEKIVMAHFETSDSRFDCTDGVEIASTAISIKKQVEKYLAPGYLDALWVYSFPPSYSFKGCEEIFWSRFDKRNLRTLVKKPHGSKGLKR